MSVVHIIDSVTDWARENICAKIRLKAPPEDADDPMDEAAAPDYKLVQPAAFSMFVPTREKLPPGILSPIPSVCVRIDDGGDELANGRGSANIIMMFSAYDPGTHGADLYVPVPGQPGLFKRNTGPEADAHFKRNGDGWRDAWNFVDLALREIESAASIGGYVLDRSAPVKYGPLKDQEAVPDFYPYWFAWVSFSLSYNLRRNVPEYKELL